MTEALPKGIVLHSERISSEIESFGGVDAEDLAKLWRGKDIFFVYALKEEKSGREEQYIYIQIEERRKAMRKYMEKDEKPCKYSDTFPLCASLHHQQVHDEGR